MKYNIQEFDMSIPVGNEFSRRVELLAMKETEILGHLSLDIFKTHTAVTWVFVAQSSRHNKIATSLIQQAWEVTKRYNKSDMGLIVDDSTLQDDVVKFYTKLNFVDNGKTSSNGVIMIYVQNSAIKDDKEIPDYAPVDEEEVSNEGI